MFDLRAETLLSTVSAMNGGKDMYGNDLRGATTLFPGAVANPGADDLDVELARMEEKVRVGAAFFQTQAVYDAATFETFMQTARTVRGAGAGWNDSAEVGEDGAVSGREPARRQRAAVHHRRDGRRR